MHVSAKDRGRERGRERVRDRERESETEREREREIILLKWYQYIFEIYYVNTYCEDSFDESCFVTHDQSE